ncbi:MAG: hypothetical protein D3924_13765 [Candidatus Electrothrix sp. AR4]|nr:hypothetical protein [Candidatus Electrothrix sp. AR4]
MIEKAGLFFLLIYQCSNLLVLPSKLAILLLQQKMKFWAAYFSQNFFNIIDELLFHDLYYGDVLSAEIPFVQLINIVDISSN